MASSLPIERAVPMTTAWKQLMAQLTDRGRQVAPRGRTTLEILHNSMVVDMQYPVLLEPARKLNYKFMAAEAYWILSGDDQLVNIEPYNKNIAQFSDDGVKFAGAYGPRYVDQRQYVVDTLKLDPDSRQATITIWQPKPAPSKDIPCTVALNFMIRDGLLHLHVFMRSSDAWLGVPYDVFNFTMMACDIAGRLNDAKGVKDKAVVPGTLFLTMASSHLYLVNLSKATQDEAIRRLDSRDPALDYMALPEALYNTIAYSPSRLMTWLDRIRVLGPNNVYRWWERTA